MLLAQVIPNPDWIDKYGWPGFVAISVVLLLVWLAKRHVTSMDKRDEAVEKQTTLMFQHGEALKEIGLAIPTICRADCPDADCENYRPRKRVS